MLHLVKVRPGKLTPVNQRSFIILKSNRPFITKDTYLTSASIVCIRPNLNPQSGVEFSVVPYRLILSLTNTRLIYFLFVVRPCINEKDVIFSVEVREKNQKRKPDTLTRGFTLTKGDDDLATSSHYPRILCVCSNTVRNQSLKFFPAFSEANFNCIEKP